VKFPKRINIGPVFNPTYEKTLSPLNSPIKTENFVSFKTLQATFKRTKNATTTT
tara:strand:- start:7967 stop:8128 length:162 start_codon:yes stop_codon:yes gene_type:complete